MAKKRKKYEFKPDPSGSGILSKLYIPRSQRLRMLKWLLYGLVVIGCLVLQDSVLSRFNLLGGVVHLAPAAIILVCVLQGAQTGSVFALVMSMIYVFSGTAPGTYAIAFLTVYSTLLAAFRQSYLRRSFASAWLCSGVAMALYEVSVFLMGLFLTQTHWGRFGVFCMTIGLSVLAMPLIYWIEGLIGRIGGETWKE